MSGEVSSRAGILLSAGMGVWRYGGMETGTFFKNFLQSTLTGDMNTHLLTERRPTRMPSERLKRGREL
jgi:hypothetical protein